MPIISHEFPNIGKLGDFERKMTYVFVKFREQNRQKGKGVSAIQF